MMAEDQSVSGELIFLLVLISWLVAPLAVAWRFATVRLESDDRRVRRWRRVPLVTGVAIVLVTIGTFGAGVVLAPVGLALTYLTLSRLGPDPGVLARAGVALNLLLGLSYLATIAIVGYDVLGVDLDPRS